MGASLAPIGTIFSAGSSIIGGISARNQARSNAEWQRYYAQENANRAALVGDWNARSILQTAALNSMLQMTGTIIEGQSIEQIAEFNANLRTLAGEYNAQLIENEAQYVAEDADLAEYYTNRAVDDYIGKVRTSYAGAGVLINQDTPADVIVDAETQKAIEVFIIRHNADRQIRRLYDNAAMSRWQGEVEAAQILHEGVVEKNLTTIRGGMASIMGIVSGQQQAQATYVNTMNNIQTTLNNGYWRAAEYDQAGDTAFMNGLFGAGTSLIDGYNKNAFKSWGLSPDSFVEKDKVPDYFGVSEESMYGSLYGEALTNEPQWSMPRERFPMIESPIAEATPMFQIPNR